MRRAVRRVIPQVLPAARMDGYIACDHVCSGRMVDAGGMIIPAAASPDPCGWRSSCASQRIRWRRRRGSAGLAVPTRRNVMSCTCGSSAFTTPGATRRTRSRCFLIGPWSMLRRRRVVQPPRSTATPTRAASRSTASTPAAVTRFSAVPHLAEFTHRSGHWFDPSIAHHC
jgi:hypothetical protein